MNGAQGGTRTRTLANYPLKVACLPVPPPGHEIHNKLPSKRSSCLPVRFDGAHYTDFSNPVKRFFTTFCDPHAYKVIKPMYKLFDTYCSAIGQSQPKATATDSGKVKATELLVLWPL